MPAMLWLLAAVFTFGAAAGLAESSQQNYYDFFVKETSYSRLCKNKTILTVNGQYPGPTITARKGEIVIVNVHNQGHKNITIHWHGVDQPRNPWYDGPELITQCPIQPGTNFTYRVILSDEEGTIWWHAHSDLDRAGVHGALIVHPKRGTDYPFKKPYKEIPIILGEWWKADVNHLLEEYLRTGGEVQISNALTINGQPGDLFPCSKKHTFKVPVLSGKTYLLRIINAGLDNDLFFGVAAHLLTVVGTDGRYLKPFTVKEMMISPGQTMDALLEATHGSSNARYYMASRTFASNPALAFNNSTATAILEYIDAPRDRRRHPTPPDFPNLPCSNDTDVATGYTAQLRSLASKDHPVEVPTHVDEHLLITLAINTLPCTTGNGTCEGPGNTRLAASLNNVSFQDPLVDILDAYYYSIQGVYEPDFPNKPPFLFNFTDNTESRRYWRTKRATKVKVVEYGAVVEVVFQDTAILGAENHPMHLHGFAFYVVGRGLGIFNETTDPATYNLVDPPYQNTVTVPKAGWAAMRFHATNPGVWFMHCHFDRSNVSLYLTSLKLVTNQKEEYVFGRPAVSDSTFIVPLQNGNGKVVAFFARYDENLKALGIYVPVTQGSPVKVGPWGDNGGEIVDITPPVQLKSVTVYSTDSSDGRIYGFSFTYIDLKGVSITTDVWGTKAKGQKYHFDLKQGEYVNDISGTTADGDGVTSLKFTTNKNPDGYGPFGCERGTAFSVPLPDGMHNGAVLGFFGRKGDSLVALGVYVGLAPKP